MVKSSGAEFSGAKSNKEAKDLIPSNWRMMKSRDTIIQ